MDKPLPVPSAIDVLSAVAVPIFVVDREFRYVDVNDAFVRMFNLKREDILGRTMFDVFEEEPARVQEVRARLERVLHGEATSASAQAWRLKNADGVMEERYWRASETPILGADGEVTHIVVSVDDVTQEMRVRRQKDVISRELEHRLTNTLTMVGSLAMMTSRDAEDVDAFVDGFLGRLQSINRTLLIVSGNSWQGLSVRRILELELAQVVPPGDPRVQISGPDFEFSVRSTKWTALIIHELITNAVRYGCFSVPDGKLSVEWTVDNGVFSCIWTETGRSIEPDLTKKGFGTVMLSLMPNMTSERSFSENGMRVVVASPAPFINAGLEPSNKSLTSVG